MALDYSLTIKHAETDYLTYNPEFVDPAEGLSGYNTVYPDLIAPFDVHIENQTLLEETDGQFVLHTDDPSICSIERKWSSPTSAQNYMNFVITTHTEHNVPLPFQGILKNLITGEETIIYPVT